MKVYKNIQLKLLFCLVIVFFLQKHNILANENRYFPNYNKPHEMAGSKIYWPKLSSQNLSDSSIISSIIKNKRYFYTIKDVLKTPCVSYEEILNKEQILTNCFFDSINKLITNKFGTKGQYFCKYITAGTSIKDNIDLLVSEKQYLIGMDLENLKKHFEKYPEDSYFFFNPKANLKDVEELNFGLCSCIVEQNNNCIQIKPQELQETIMKDVRDQIIKQEILKCYSNDIENAEKNIQKVLVLIHLPEDIKNLTDTIQKKLEINYVKYGSFKWQYYG